MDATITGRLWDFGDGTVSNVQHPFHIYKEPGFYDVSLTITLSDMTEYNNTQRAFIKVFAFSDAIFDYNAEKTCLVYGDGKFGGNGWSIFSGDWMFPESSGAILQISENQRPRTKIIFDYNTGLPFIINSDERHFTGDVYRDKVGHPDEPLGFPIESKIVTPSYTGESRKFKVNHEETFVDVNPIKNGDDYPFPLNMDVSLFGDDKLVSTETLLDLDPEQEVLFTDKKKFDRVQVGVKVSESGYKIGGIETLLKVSDTARYASATLQESSGFEMYLAQCEYWFSRSSYSINKYNNEESLIVGTPIFGPDTYTQTGLTVSATVYIDITEMNKLYFWSEDATLFQIDGLLVTNEPYFTDSSKTDWEFFVIDVSNNSELTLTENATMFDMRISRFVLTDESYLSMYTDDVIKNKGSKFLTGYIE
jgi:PKD repeat protein